jgi:glycosyltransferase involved in cell wall biosynthesis
MDNHYQPTCLMIAYYFPPGGGVGVQRSVKFAKYLLEMGWSPVILSTENSLGISRDETLVSQLPAQAPIYRVKPWFSTEACFDSNRSFWTRLFCACLIPDSIIPWIQPAVQLGCRVVEDESVDAIYSTSPPHSSHLVGYGLKKRTGLPWVADFRDAWLADPDRNRAFHNRLRAATLEKWMEGLVVRHADRIITVSDPIRDDFLQRYPGLLEDRVTVITNGYDPDDFAGLERKSWSKFTFTLTGSMSKSNRGPRPLIEGVRALLSQHPALADRFQVLLVGPHTPEQSALLADYGLVGVVQLVGEVTYREALSYQLCADVNVFVYNGPGDGRSAQMMSSKIFEYIGAGHPILAVAPPDSAASRLVEDLQLGRTESPHSPEDTAGVMYEMLENKVNTTRISSERLQRFHRRYLTQQLAGVLDNLAKG